MLEIFLIHFFAFLKILEIGENFEWILLLTAFDNFFWSSSEIIIVFQKSIKISPVSKTQES